jgi:hypothetical protein
MALSLAFRRAQSSGLKWPKVEVGPGKWSD